MPALAEVPATANLADIVARRAAEHLKEEMRTQAAADINTERQRLRREIEAARDQALQDIMRVGKPG